MKKIGILILILCVSFSSSLCAQKYSRLLTVGYSGGYTVGGINNFIKNKNFDGITVDGRYFVKDNLSIGFATGWSSFKNELPRQIYQIENGEISAVQTRYLRNIPLLVSSHYYFAKEGAKVIPYAGAGIGAYLVTYEKWFGNIPVSSNNWSFGIRPEVGLYVPVTEKVWINANVRYNYGTYKHEEVNDFTYAEGMIGVGFYFW